MGPAGEESTVLSNTQDFISINQKISLPDNYKKFSTIKLRIKPAKLIFVGSGNNSNIDKNPCPYVPAAQNVNTKENKSANEHLPEKSRKTSTLDSSYLLNSAENLSEWKDRRKYIPTDCEMYHKAKRSEFRPEYQMTQTSPYITESEPNEDCEIVKELVLEKFKDLLQKFIEKSNSRRTFSMGEDENLRGWTEYETIHILDPFIFNLQQEVNQQLKQSENSNKIHSRNIDEFEEETKSHMSLSPCTKNNARKSIITEDTETISLSQNQYPEHVPRREHHPSYVHISEPLETVQTLQYIENKAETIENESIVSYQPDDDSYERKCDYYINKLKDEINEQTCAIIQVLKILSMCERDKKLSESVLRVEAERVLLIATLRRDILNTELANPDCNENDKNGFVLISGLKIPLDQIQEPKLKQTIFFVVILHCGSTVFCSDLLRPNSRNELEVGEPFCFEELSTDFEISVEIFTMHLKIREKSTGAKMLKKYRNFIFGLRSRFRNSAQTNPRETSTSRKSAFSLIGRTLITRTKLQLREFPLENVNSHNFNLKELTCNIGSGVKLDIFLSGFLMVCESSSGKTRWRRQWCILDASELKFWDYPGKEQTAEPNTIIDLSRSLLPYIVLADRKFCSRPRSLHLKIGPDTAQEEFYHKDIFLAADNPRDFLFWERELNRVLKNLINWGCMKSYFENSL